HYTTDNTEPIYSSPAFSRGQILMPGPGWLKIKSFPNRPQYHRSGQGNFQSGEAPLATAKSKSSKTGLKYNLYEGNWESFPKEKKSKPIQSGNIDEKFNINSPKSEKNLFYVIEGTMDIPEDAYYIFYSSSKNGGKVSVGDKLLFETDGTGGDIHSFVVPLKKGTYRVHLEFFRKKDGGDIHFRIFRTKAKNENWWQTDFFKL
ncbi:MAG TPA: hypothetical protein VFO54_09385, partial [Chryseosolibacter sp.]|nr:hypothetical protein [Chryseosolibacter sp.]